MKRTPLKSKKPLKACKGFTPKPHTAMRTPLRRTKLAPVSKKRAAGKAVAIRASIRRKPKPKPTAEQLARWQKLYEAGCVACELNSDWERPRASVLYGKTEGTAADTLEIHHLLSGGKRMGHDFTICLCRYHHQGDIMPVPRASRFLFDYTPPPAIAPYAVHANHYGPSLAREPRRFRELYGRELEQLERQNELLAEKAFRDSFRRQRRFLICAPGGGSSAHGGQGATGSNGASASYFEIVGEPVYVLKDGKVTS